MSEGHSIDTLYYDTQQRCSQSTVCEYMAEARNSVHHGRHFCQSCRQSAVQHRLDGDMMDQIRLESAIEGDKGLNTSQLLP